MRHHSRWLLAASLALALSACDMNKQADSPAPASANPLDTLMAGNARFVSGRPTHVQNTSNREELANGQHPIAIIVSCSDSRVPPEAVFDQGLGQLFVVRVAGNIVDDHALGSIEYAAEHLHSHLVIVLGHDKCGAVAATVDGGEAPAHIASIVQAIKPAVDQARTQKDGELLDNAIDDNARNVANTIAHSKPLLSHMTESGELKVVAARYKLTTGQVQLLGPATP